VHVLGLDVLISKIMLTVAIFLDYKVQNLTDVFWLCITRCIFNSTPITENIVKILNHNEQQ